MSHVLIVTDDSVALLHPDACATHQECKEGAYERTYGLPEGKPVGSHPVSWWGDFYDGEYDEGLGDVVPDELVDLDEPSPSYSGAIRGFPYRWAL